MVQVDPDVSAAYYFNRSMLFKHEKDFAEFYKSSLLYLAFISSDSLPQDIKLVCTLAQPTNTLTWSIHLRREINSRTEHNCTSHKCCPACISVLEGWMTNGWDACSRWQSTFLWQRSWERTFTTLASCCCIRW